MRSPEDYRRDKECGLILLITLVLVCSFANWLEEHDKKLAAEIKNQEIVSQR